MRAPISVDIANIERPYLFIKSCPEVSRIDFHFSKCCVFDDLRSTKNQVHVPPESGVV
jgi:hypothetical protein